MIEEAAATALELYENQLRAEADETPVRAGVADVRNHHEQLLRAATQGGIPA